MAASAVVGDRTAVWKVFLEIITNICDCLCGGPVTQQSTSAESPFNTFRDPLPVTQQST